MEVPLNAPPLGGLPTGREKRRDEFRAGVESEVDAVTLPSVTDTLEVGDARRQGCLNDVLEHLLWRVGRRGTRRCGWSLKRRDELKNAAEPRAQKNAAKKNEIDARLHGNRGKSPNFRRGCCEWMMGAWEVFSGRLGVGENFLGRDRRGNGKAGTLSATPAFSGVPKRRRLRLRFAGEGRRCINIANLTPDV